MSLFVAGSVKSACAPQWLFSRNVISRSEILLCAITIKGATEETNHWIRSQLQIASVVIDDAEPAWQPGTPANGTPKGKAHWRQGIQDRLNEIGLQGDGAVIDLVRNDEAKTLDLHLALSSTDPTVEVSVPGDSNDAVAEPSDQGSGNPTLARGLRGEPQQIHRRLFSSPMTGVRLYGIEDNWTCELILGQQTAIATIENESHRRIAVLEGGEAVISMDDPPAAIRFPVLSASVILQVESSAESGGKTTRLTLAGAFVTYEPERPVRTGVVFTEQCWAEWFPSDSTQRSEDEQ